MRALLLLLCLAALPLALPAQEADTAGDVEAESRYLIARVAESDRVFWRNGNRHTGPQAAEHIQRKYEHFRDRITTGEQFIELAASRSTLTGKPYEILLADGRRQPLAQWLLKHLEDYRLARGAAAGKSP